jgi:hypothetical protein
LPEVSTPSKNQKEQERKKAPDGPAVRRCPKDDPQSLAAPQRAPRAGGGPVGQPEAAGHDAQGVSTRLLKRHKTKTTLITSNLGFSEWGTFLKNNHLTGALLDRLTETSHVINMKHCRSLRTRLDENGETGAE